MRPSLSLACILKNEVQNIPQLLASVEGCFDGIHFTDTGSTDGSIELLTNYHHKNDNPANTPIFLHHFDWVHDFAKARQASFKPVTTDYVMWLDLDDVLSDKTSFIGWRDSVMKIADFWMATYHYASHEGIPTCSFARERVVKRNLEFSWRYFIHEGLVPKSPHKDAIECQYATTWSVVHKRTDTDLKADRSRNLIIFEKNKASLDSRMRYYYGKELFEHGKHLEAFTELINAISEENLELHDRITGIQYAALCAMALSQWEKAISLAHQGLQLCPQRAEFQVIIADSYLKQNKIADSIPYYRAASACDYHGKDLIQGGLFHFEESYKHYPLNQLARVYVNLEQFDKADKALTEAMALGPHSETLGIEKEFHSLKENLGFRALTPKTKSEDIVISCHPGGPYEWDEEVYQTTGIGGSETAAIEMAKWLGKLTSRNIHVFNNRTSTKIFGKVAYRPAGELRTYFSALEPKLHIAWRHNVKLTNAPTFLWCHDLAVPGLDKENFTKILALSNFHKEYLKNIFNLKEEKIWVTGNGIDPTRFIDLAQEKTPGKVVFSSSPDRGLKRAILVMDEVVKEVPESTLHVFYGFENMLKAGKADEVKALQKMISERPHIIFRGNLSQQELTKELSTSCVWLYPTNFLETYCITAVEMLCAKVYPVARRWGALENTLEKASQDEMAKLISSDCETKDEISYYALQTVFALKEELYKKVLVNPHDYSWENRAKSWINEFSL